jgi:hypothetical protein
MQIVNRLNLGQILLCALSLAQAQTYTIPQVADGGGWQTTLVISNSTTGTATAALTCYKETTSGATTTWSAPFQESTSTSNLSLAAAGTLFLHTAGTAATTSVGWCALDADSGIEAYAIFTQTSASSTQDGTAVAAAAAPRALIPFDNVSGMTTSVAVVNPNSSPEIISASIRAADGTITKTSLGTLPANGHMAFELPKKFTATAGKRGLIELYNTSGSLSALALRFNSGGSFTTAPAYAGTGDPIIGSSAAVTVSVRSIALSTSSTVSGAVMSGTVTLSTAAPSGGVSVALTSSDASVATVPAYVIVDAGAKTAIFSVTPNTVTASRTVTITASYGGNSVSTTLTVKPNPNSNPAWFSRLTLALTVTPVGYSASTAAASIVANSADATYTSEINGPSLMMNLIDGTVSDSGLVFSFSTLGSTGYQAFLSSSLNMQIKDATVTITLSSPTTSGSGVKSGTLTGTFSVTGVPSGTTAGATVSGTLSGTYYGS